MRRLAAVRIAASFAVLASLAGASPNVPPTAASAAASAAASTAAPAASRSPADTLVVPLEQVSVTGSRIPETVLRTPAAVSVVDRREFTHSRLLGLDEALGGVPGVLVQSRAGAQDVRVTIRGFGARGNGERSNAGNMRGILFLSDGVPVTEPDGRTSLDLADLGSTARIEILRSNASALYGNASGGVLHLRTNLEFPERYADVAARVGAFGFHREQGSLGLVTGGATRSVLTLSNSTFDGWREHSSSSATRFVGRMATALDPRTRLALALDLVRDLNRFPGPLTAAELDSAPQQANPTYAARDERRDNSVGRVALDLDRTLGDRSALDVVAYVEPKVLRRSERNRFRDFHRTHVGGHVVYEGARSLAPSVDGQLVAGADAAHQDGSILFYDLGPGGSRGTVLVADQREAATSAGAFVQGGVRLGRAWDVRLAVRYDDLGYVSEDHQDPALDATKHFSAWTPKASVARFLDAHTIYASLGGGLEAPAFNEIDPPPPYDTLTSLNPFLDPMRSRSFELGVKGEIGRSGPRALGYDVALYWIETEDEIVPYDGGAYFFSAGETRRQGIELWLDSAPWARGRARASLTQSRTRYLDYRPDGTEQLAGNRLPGLPEVVATLRVSHRFAAGLALDAGGEVVGSYFADDRNTANVPAYVVLDAGASYRRALSADVTLDAFLSGRNLTDRSYVASVFINGVNGQYYEPGLPINVTGGITMRWK